MNKLLYDFYCENCGNIRERYDKQNKDNDVCECGEKMELKDLRENIEAFHFNRVHSMPIEEKRKVLKKRAADDHEKNHKEKKTEIDKEHTKQAKKLIGKMKDKQIKQH